MAVAEILSDPSHAEEIRHRIMDAAEKSFAQWGFDAASLRQITSDANVNLAAVSYYFGSKENLYTAIISRGVEPLNRDRLSLLEQARQKEPDAPLSLETILEAFCRPCFDFVRRREHQPLLVLLGKSMYENESFIFDLMKREWEPIVNRFLAELHRSLPGLGEADLAWRFHFTVGAMIHTVSQTRALEYLTQGQCTLSDGDAVLRHLVSFCAAGLKMPGATPV